jgi:hypothetical protein
MPRMDRGAEAALRVMAGGCAKQLTAFGDRDPARWRRYGELIASALRP